MASTIVVDKIQKTGGVPFTLPVADATVSGQSLQSDASGNLSWGSVDPIIAKGGDIASAAPTVIPDGNLYYDVTGTTNFAAFTVTAGRHFILQFDAGVVMTHHATNLDLPGEASITTVAGDVAEFVATGTNTAQCINYTRATGKAPVESVTLANSVTLTNKTLTAPAVTNLTGTLNSPTGTIGATTLGGAVTGGDQTITAVNLKDYGETTNAIGSIGGGTQDIDLALGNSISGTVDTGTTTFTFSNPTASDEGCGFTLVLTNGLSQTVNWPASVDWAGGTAPTLIASGVDILTFWTIDGGTIWHGMLASADSKTPS